MRCGWLVLLLAGHLGCSQGGATDSQQDAASGTSDGGADLAKPAAAWAKAVGEGYNTNLVAYAPGGQILVAGNFASQIDLGTGPLTTTQTTGGYLGRLTASGSALQARAMVGSGAASVGAMSVDPSGGVIVAGNFIAAVDFGAGLVNSRSPDDLFVARYDADGKLVWLRQYGETGSQYAQGVALGPDGSIALCGIYSGSVNLGGTTITKGGMFVARYDAAGKLQWVQVMNDGNPNAGGVAINAQGDVILSGDIYGTTDLGGGPIPLMSRGAFVARYAVDGKLVWAKVHRTSAPAYSVGTALALDAAGDILVGGSFFGRVDTGSGTVTSSGETDGFVSRYAADGNLLWTRNFGGPQSDGVTAVAAGPMGQTWASGHFRQEMDVGGQKLQSAGDLDGLMLQYGRDGLLMQARRIGGPKSDDAASIAVDGSGKPTVTGLFQDTASFDGIVLNTTARWGIFLFQPN